MNKLNQGRLFILAGHSQGSSILIALLENYMTKHPEHLKRMVAAYPIGFAVTKDNLGSHNDLKQNIADRIKAFTEKNKNDMKNSVIVSDNLCIFAHNYHQNE